MILNYNNLIITIIIMSLFTDWDLNILSNNINNINTIIQKNQLEIYEPNKQEKQEVTQIILDYIKQNKRKIYEIGRAHV